MNAAFSFIDASQRILDNIRETQMDAIEQASEICARSISGGGLVHLFGTGHSRIMIEEMFPRHGSYAGFHGIVELSMTFHNQVVGMNGQRQAMFIEHVEGLAAKILRNFVISAPDSMMIFTNSGVNEVVVDMALEAKKLDLPVIAVVSVDHCQKSKPKHSSGKRLIDVVDVVIDNCVPAGDALVKIDGLDDPVGPGSTIGASIIVNALKSRIAQKLTEVGQPPLVLSSGLVIGAEESTKRFDEVYDDYRARVRRVYGNEAPRIGRKE